MPLVSAAYNFTNTGHRKYAINAASTRFQFINFNNKLSEIDATPGPPHVANLSGGGLASNSILRRPGLLKRTSGATFNGCSNDQQLALPIAASSAQFYASATTSYLRANAHGTPRYTTWFGAYDDAHHDTVLGHFAQIGGNDFSEFAYDCTCDDPAVYAYVYPDQFGTIYLCGAFWGAPTVGADSQAGTLVHEVSNI